MGLVTHRSPKDRIYFKHLNMKKRISSILILAFLFSFGSLLAREVVTIQSGWKFSKGSNDQAYQKDFNDSKWETVSIPHDWAISGPFIEDGDGSTGKLPWKGEAWYRNVLKVSKELKDKTIYLIFDGIMAFPQVYINGELAGKWDYGYNSFYLDVTDFVVPGDDNTIAIHVDTRNHDSRWYPGAGIYRKIQMISADPVHVDIWGSYVTTPIIKKNYSDVRVAHEINNKSASDKQNISVENIIISPQGKEVARKTETMNIRASEKKRTEVTFTLNRPEKWDINNPVLYKVKTLVSVDGKVVDEHITPFGVRSIRFTPDEGFYLNDRRVQFKGVCLHSDFGPLGVAFNTRAMERQLEIMKSMGVNAIRNSHNTAAPELPELCDKMGLLFFNEVFDKYDAKAGILDTTNFENFAHRNIANFIKRDRNHPSVFLWSVGNEIMDVMNNRDNGFYRLNIMISYVRMYDPSRPVTLVSSFLESALKRHFDYYDVHAWNYDRRYRLARQLEPNKSVIISESASTLSTRGFYELPLPEKKTDFTKSLQVSSYDLHAPLWAEIADDDFMWQEEENYVAGEFVWTGFDYLGEPTPYTNQAVKKMGYGDTAASRSSYFGVVDLVGIPKDRYYLYKSYWMPEEKTIHILPHWNWEEKEGENVPVFVYTNGDSAELMLNGISQGFERKIVDSEKSVERYRLMWKNVVYQPGELKAVAYKDGEVLGEQIVRTASEIDEIRLTPDKTLIRPGIKDLSYVLIEAFDKDGNPVPLADNLVKFDIKGPGIIAGVGNGNPQSFSSFQAPEVKLFYGKAMLIIEGGDKPGIINIKASINGLKDAKTSVEVR